jgi:hypothetical protein
MILNAHLVSRKKIQPRIIHVRIVLNWKIIEDKIEENLIIIPIEEDLSSSIKIQLEELIEKQIKEKKMNRGEIYLLKVVYFPQQVEIYYQDKLLLCLGI